MNSGAGGLRLMLVGASGAVGQAVLRQALAEKRVGAVHALTRRPLAMQHPKLVGTCIDFSRLDNHPVLWSCDALVCTLGTTIKAAGSQQAFAFVDRDLPVEIARRTRLAGATRCGLNSSVGASLNGNFYLRTKAEAESGICRLGFASTTIVRPSLIDTVRTESRLGERAGLFVAAMCKPIIPRRYRPVTPDAIARRLLEGVLTGNAGVHIVESEALA